MISPGATDPVLEEGEELVWVRDLEVDGALRVGGGGKVRGRGRPEAWVFRRGGGLEAPLGLGDWLVTSGSLEGPETSASSLHLGLLPSRPMRASEVIPRVGVRVTKCLSLAIPTRCRSGDPVIRTPRPLEGWARRVVGTSVSTGAVGREC